ncbi:uncharacterized protein LOC128230964 [Mya arenaria]|uniref:uncharacterized protein LOC128230964 n=1 Tax=Mya arenaria TaxID=6604 RepID=UPI0022E72947|nr:uncharacterized protein LOC128230964 [Mya arenaria]
MYEFDCKPDASVITHGGQFIAVQFENQYGYIHKDTNIQSQTCPGSPPATDIGTIINIKAQHPTTNFNNADSSIVDYHVTSPNNNTDNQACSAGNNKYYYYYNYTDGNANNNANNNHNNETIPSSTPTHSTSTTTTRRTTTTTTLPTTTTTLKAPTTEYAYWKQAANVTGTPLQYIGLGYNLLTGNPEMASDPALLLDKRVLQLTKTETTEVQEASVQLGSTCSNSKRHTLVHGSLSLQGEMKAFVQASSTHPPSLTGSSFTGNSEFVKAQTKLNAGEEVYQDHVITCKLGTAQYDLVGAQSNHFTVSHDFAKAVCNLSTFDSSSESQYLTFLDQWGTDPSVLDHSGYFKGHTSSLTINMGRYNQSALATHSFGSPDQLTVGIISNPKPIRIEVAPIFDFIQWNYFQPIMFELKARHECVDTMQAHDLQLIANNVRSVMAQYGQHKGATGTTDHPLQAPVTWPLGKFGLMKAASGCPGNDVHWVQGWRKHDTEDSGAHNYFTPGVNNYLSGYFYTNNIKTNFCIKNTRSVTSYDTNWPKGSYCILKYGGSCPFGFQNGFILWDDEDVNNHNERGGTLPDGEYGSNTKIYYCCRNDGRTSTAISLPTDRPFILMRLTAACQAVYGMGVTDVFVRWDDDDFINNSGRGGLHPYDDGGSKDHMLHFCYYHSTAHGGIVG